MTTNLRRRRRLDSWWIVRGFRFVDPAWIGTVSALAGASVAGALGFARDYIGARQQHSRDDAQRAHEVEERRFDARRDAYVTFAAACHKTISATDDFEMEHMGALPGDHGYDGPHRKVLDALDLVRIIGPQQVIDAALDASLKLDEWAFGSGPANRDQAEAAVDHFAAVSRGLLKFEVV